MICAGNLLYIRLRELPMNSVRKRPKFARIDEQCLPSTIAKSRIAFVATQEPQANRYRSGIKQLPWQRNHAINKIRFDDPFLDLSFPGLTGRHRSIRQHETCHTIGREVIDEVLHPSEVGIASWRHAIRPSPVGLKQFPAPVTVIERWIRKDVVGF